MAPSQRPDNLSLQELEALVLAKRRQITERAVMRFALLERELTQRQAGSAEREGYWFKLRPPESWRGANGQDRYFRGVKLTPLEAIGAKWRALPTAEIKSAGQPLPYVATVVIEDGATRQRRRWRDILLLSVEVLALVGFIAVLGSSYVRLRALNDQAREMQRAAVADISTTSAPATVQLTLHLVRGDRNRALVQLVNGTGWQGQVLTEVIPLHQVSVWVRGPWVAARELVTGQDLALTPRGTGVSLVLPQLDDLAAIELITAGQTFATT